jgi:hypothetical protein
MTVKVVRAQPVTNVHIHCAVGVIFVVENIFSIKLK